MTPTRPRRADAQRNRDRILAAAREELAAADRSLTLDAVANRAGVGIGTLYRHFPNRDVLVEELYAAELDQLVRAAPALLGEFPPETALRRWLDRYSDFTRAKRGLLDALRSGRADGHLPMAATRERISAALGPILEAGSRDGSLRSGIEPGDVTVLLHAVFIATAATNDPHQTARLLDLVVDALRAGPS
ncbi:MAG: TetR/AcrR family transcriptional regulator [Dermatophilaceae bacterium]